MKKKGKKTAEELPKVHPELQGLSVWIDETGEIQWSMPIDRVNRFLNQHVVDSRLKDRLGYKSDQDDETTRFMY